MKPFAFISVIAATLFVVAGCGSAPAQSLSAVGTVSRTTPDGAYPGAFVASTSGGAGTASGLAVFSSADGRLTRWLVRSKSQPVPAAVSPGGAWVYYYYPATSKPPCPSEGFAEPRLWRVRVTGGRPERTNIRTTDLAFSPDGKMVAYTSERNCGQTPADRGARPADGSDTPDHCGAQ
jgi:hypothetical protein